MVLLLSLGCGGGSDGPPLVPVSGTVTFEGKPLAGALVTFIPTGHTRGTDASGRTDKDGNYTLATPQGRAGTGAGTYKVTISRLLLPDGTVYVADPAIPPVDAPARESLPPRYSELDHTTLAAKVPPSGGSFPFPLKQTK